jgi:NitT/TauT family transport system permease protein
VNSDLFLKTFRYSLVTNHYSSNYMPAVLENRIHARTPARQWRIDLVAQRVALVALIFGIWWLVSLRMPHYVLPGPARVLDALHRISANGELWNNLGITLGRVAAGFSLATLIGLPLGIVLGASKRLGEFFEPIIPVMNTISSAIWAIFAIIWFGVSNATTIFVVFMTAMPLIITNVWQGTRTVNADFIELAHTLRMPHGKVMTKIYLPSILPYFFSGARLAFGFGWRVSLVAETIGSSSGVGYRLRQAADLIQTDQVFAWTLALVVMMAFIEMGVLRPLENHLFRWKKEAE